MIRTQTNNYAKLLLLHAGFGILVFLHRPAAIFMLLLILMWFLQNVLRKHNRNHEALMAAAYFAGAEVFFRMTGGSILYESGKYLVILFLIIGITFKGMSTRTFIYWIYLLILVPGTLVAAFFPEHETSFRKSVAFNLSGPVCLGIATAYCFYRRLTAVQFERVLQMLLLPIVTSMVYLYLQSPGITEALWNSTSSNFATSGGYGPNQVSTLMGLGVFLLCIRLISIRNLVINSLDSCLLGLMLYRAILTFSRGGLITAVVCSICFLLGYYLQASAREKIRLRYPFFWILLLGMGISAYAVTQTNGLLLYRYSNKDVAGKVEADFTTGRASLMRAEWEGFLQQPLLGVGVGGAKLLRESSGGKNTASHTEFSRLLAEHGIPGVVACFILIGAPLIYNWKARDNLLFFPFLLFWFLTSSHSAMRTALPALLYALSLLYIEEQKETD